MKNNTLNIFYVIALYAFLSISCFSMALTPSINLIAEAIKIKSLQIVQMTSRLSACMISTKEPLEKLRLAGALAVVGGSLYGMLVVPDKFFGSIGEDFEKKYDQYPKIKPRAIGSLLNWYHTKNNNKNYQQSN